MKLDIEVGECDLDDLASIGGEPVVAALGVVVVGREIWRSDSAGASLNFVARTWIIETSDDAELESFIDSAAVGRELDSVAVLNDVGSHHRALAQLLFFAASSFSAEVVCSTIRRSERNTLVNCQRVIKAVSLALDAEMFRNDRNVALTGDVDGPGAVQVVVVVARIVETGRRDDGVAGGDRAAAIFDNGVYISMNYIGLRLSSGCKSNKRRDELNGKKISFFLNSPKNFSVKLTFILSRIYQFKNTDDRALVRRL